MSKLMRIVWRRVRGANATIKTVYVGVLTLYSVMTAAADLSFLANLAIVSGIILLVPAAVVTFNVLTSPRDPLAHLLSPGGRTRAPLDMELGRAQQQGLKTWWDASEHESRWFDSFFAFWWKGHGISADTIQIVCSEPELSPGLYKNVPDEEVRPSRPHRKKAALVRASSFLTDSEHVLECAPMDYELGMWVDRNGGAFRGDNPDASLFGVEGWEPYPAVLCTHNVLMTGDHWVVMALRSPRTDFYPNTWSLSFEEQVEIGKSDVSNQLDATVGAAIRRGIREEFGRGIAESVSTIRSLALGRENTDTETRSVRSAAILSVVSLDVPLSKVWQSLARPGGVVDVGENTSWMGVRFQHRNDAVAMLKRYPPGSGSGLGPVSIRQDHRLSVEVNVHPNSLERLESKPGFGWHPTSRPRLLLWAEWAAVNGVLRV